MEINNEQYHHALALYMLAVRQQKEVSALVEKAHDILGQEWGSHLDDAVYDTANNGTEREFKGLLDKMEIKVLE